VQWLLVEHPERLLSATVISAATLQGTPALDDGTAQAAIYPELLELWSHMFEPRELEAEIEWRIENWRKLNGKVISRAIENPKQDALLPANSLQASHSPYAYTVSHAIPDAHRRFRAGSARGGRLRLTRQPPGSHRGEQRAEHAWRRSRAYKKDLLTFIPPRLGARNSSWPSVASDPPPPRWAFTFPTDRYGSTLHMTLKMVAIRG
jgi:hypothetical protein